MAEFGDDGTIMRTLFKIYSSILAFSLLLGTLFAPFTVKAGLFSSILGNQVSADVVDSSNPTKIVKNSQTMSLLQADVSFASILQEKKDKNSVKNNTTDDTNTDTAIVSGKAFQPTIGSGSMGSLGGKDTLNSCSDHPSTYTVIDKDSISQIAKMFGVSVNTILVANDMKKSDKLTLGQVLFIPAISGVEHTVTTGQTLKSIAKFYKVDINDIAFCNGIAPDAKLKTGVELVIPGGDNMADEGGDEPAPNLSSSVARDINYYITRSIQSLVDFFIYPLPSGVGRKTQGLHGPGKRGIDYGAPKGTPIYASAKGVVSIICRGWCGGYGTMAIIEHPDKDTKTLYAHMSKIAVQTDEEVAQGKIIGYVGSTGRSTGPHLHFEVFYFKNPGVDGSWVQ